MSVFKKQALVTTSPAFNVYEREASGAGQLHITPEDVLAVACVTRSGQPFYRTYKPGSVASYALEYNECPFEALARARQNGHPIHWIAARSSVLSDSRSAAEDVVLVKPGMKVHFQGHDFLIQEAPNNNLSLAEI